jgi:hypothetical protein
VSAEVIPARTLWVDLAFFALVVNDCVIVMFCAHFGCDFFFQTVSHLIAFDIYGLCSTAHTGYIRANPIALLFYDFSLQNFPSKPRASL